MAARQDKIEFVRDFRRQRAGEVVVWDHGMADLMIRLGHAKLVVIPEASARLPVAAQTQAPAASTRRGRRAASKRGGTPSHANT